MKIFVLEDDPERIAWFRKTFAGAEVHVTDRIQEAETLLTLNQYDRLYLDHDLGDFSGRNGYNEPVKETGYDFAQWLADNPFIQREATVVIHSVNPGGAERMWQTLQTSRDAVLVPFPILAKIERGTN